MIIDFHTHTFPDQIAAAAIARLSNRAHIPAYSSGTAGGLLLAERAAGVDRSIILPVATKPEQVHHINDAAAAHNEHAFVTNMFSFACIHPDYADWKQELDRIAARNMRGIKLHPAYQQTDLDDPKYLRILERAGALGADRRDACRLRYWLSRLPMLHAGKGEKCASSGRSCDAGAGAYGWLVLLGRSSGATCGYPGSAGHGLLAPSGGRSGGRSPMAF